MCGACHACRSRSQRCWKGRAQSASFPNTCMVVRIQPVLRFQAFALFNYVLQRPYAHPHLIRNRFVLKNLVSKVWHGPKFYGQCYVTGIELS